MCDCLASVEESWQVLHWAPTGGKLRGVARSSHRAELCECQRCTSITWIALPVVLQPPLCARTGWGRNGVRATVVVTTAMAKRVVRPCDLIARWCSKRGDMLLA